MSSPVTDRPASKILDLEVKDARIIFNPSWEDLEEEVGRENLRFPKEIILLGGAPGAGKGTQTQFINETRGLTCPPIVISDLLTTPEMEKLKAQGVMVGDKEVVGLLLRKLLEPTYRDGVVLDGFPRTPVQVECLKLLVDKINELHDQFAGHAAGHPLPPADDSRDGAVRQREHEHRAAARSRTRDRRAQQEGRRDRRSARRSICARRICPKSSCAAATGSSRNRPGPR